ncbi:MAG: hypothetical protein IJU37_00630, partial [Desulfovibrio sp.]|nr:hypothetical protein [Desulfovibrio sp.]
MRHARVLFRDRPVRSELLSLPVPDVSRTVRIAVHRNHSFELLESVINVYLALSDMRADFWYSGYDDSLSFADSFPQDVAVHILWFDAARHHDQA